MMDNFSEVSDLYARYRPAYPAEMYEFILSHLAERKAAWDSATGSGQVAGYLADYFDEVYANDISTQQMSFAQAKPNVQYFNAPSEETGFPPDKFNLITVAQAIHWFNFDKYYSEVKRTARSNALFAVIGYGLCRISKEIDALLDNFDKNTFDKYFTLNRKYINEAYAFIPFPFKEIKAPLFKKEYNWSLADLEGFFNSWSSVQKIKKEEGYNPVEGFIKSVTKYWKKDELKPIEFPVFIRLGIIEK